MTAFVHNLARAAESESLRRWNHPMCPLVAGLPQAQGEFMLARISEVARRAAVPLGDEHCHPNLYIVATPDPEELLKSWKQRDRSLYGDAMPGQVRRFLEHDRPGARLVQREPRGRPAAARSSPQASELGTNYRPDQPPRQGRPGYSSTTSWCSGR